MATLPDLRPRQCPRRLACRLAAIAVATALLNGCGTWFGSKTPPAPPGPTATIVDTALGGGTAGQLGEGGGLFFYVSGVERLDAPARRPTTLRFQHGERELPAGPVRLRLKGTLGPSYAMPSLLRLGGSQAVEGEVEVQLEPGKRYRVNGRLDATRREVWLEDEDHEIVGTKVVARAPRVPDPVDSAGDLAYTCCNLRYEKEWISDANEFGRWFIPAGTRIELKSLSGHYAQVLVNGRKMTLAQDYGGKRETMQQYAAKLVVRDDPRLRLATWPAEVQAAVLAGRLLPGMTREQVLMSLGPPRADATPSMTLPRWRYWLDTDEEIDFSVHFGADDRIARIDADADVLERLVYRAP